MAKLLDLPTELLLLILSHFDHFMYKYELQSLCISSKRLYSIAQPLLYRDFVREVNCQCCHKIGTPPGRIIPLVLFTRTLISRPDLASCVRSAAFDNSENVFDDEDVCEVEFGADTFKVLATGFQQVSGICRTRLFMEAAAMKSNPYTVVLASSMPNLERLKLTIGEEGLYDLEPLFTQWHTNNPAQPYLRNLKSVVIRDLTLTESGSMVDLDYIQELPHLEEFTLINLNGDAEGCPLFEIQLETLNISSLSLLEACLDTESLTAIVDGCRCLKHFSYYGCNYDGNNIEESSQFDPSELVSILPHKIITFRHSDAILIGNTSIPLVGVGARNTAPLLLSKTSSISRSTSTPILRDKSSQSPSTALQSEILVSPYSTRLGR